MSDPVRDSPISVKPGDVLGGKFRVERVLGEGGMGVVVAARHIGLNQLVAMKFMLPHALLQEENVARFEREARAAVRLKSDHVAKVSDVGRLETGAPYMVMEFLEGEDLDQFLQNHGAPDFQTAVDFVLQACEAVAEAHSLGIIHRDLKPRNLFLTRTLSGKPLIKVLDFGISKSVGADDMSLTSTTQVMGSPNYMSPEQLRSARDVDLRTDIWALGAILYELITGRVPFLAESVTQLTAMVFTELPTPVRSLRADVPAGLVDVVMKCLEKRASDRFSSVGELANALAPFASLDGASKAKDILTTTGNRSGPYAPLSASSSGSIPAPAERPSVRVAGPPGAGGTESAWDQTQLAPGQKKGKVSVAVLLLAALAAAAAVGALAVVLTRHPDTAKPTPPPPATSVVVVVSAAPTTPTNASNPLPALPTATAAPSHGPAAGPVVTGKPLLNAKPDAATAKPPDTAPTVTQTAKPPDDSLPNSRN